MNFDSLNMINILNSYNFIFILILALGLGLQADSFYINTKIPKSTKPIIIYQASQNSADRIESIKAASVSTLIGSISYLPLGLISGFISKFSPQWEFNSDALAISLALFGITYRYTIRNDANDQLKQGVVGAFAVTRSLSMLDVSNYCTSLPLYCGPPFGYLNYEMIFSGILIFTTSLLSYGAAAVAIDLFIDFGIISPKK